MKRIETLLEKISITGLILYIAGIISLIACAIATVVKAMTWIDMLHYAGCIFGCGFALMAVGSIGLALIGKAEERKRLAKKN